ncbi:hypothetical protein BJX61DRAFT_538606 [Aspergillus egyptiacus]|nr:hypothetical protein BJX61DRAFT_538606 [Aspergillus egyptiacus]
METRSARLRKRGHSINSNVGKGSPVLRDETQTRSAPSCKTPRRPNKRVRFSDPGPAAQHTSESSTGLTPALYRTSLENRAYANDSERTPSRKSRRHSTPLPRSRRVSDSPLPVEDGSETVLHFTPLRQLLDARTQRRIRRIGLSNEINNLEREKRATAQYKQSLESLLRERDSLKQALDLAKKERLPLQNQPPSDDRWLAFQDQIEHLEAGNNEMMAQLSSSAKASLHPQPTPSVSDADTVIVNDSSLEGDTVFMSDSPDIRAMDLQPFGPDHFSLNQKESGIDVSVQTSHPARNLEPEFVALSRDLEAARKEKRNLFDACRSHLDLLEGTSLGRHLRQQSPPPDFYDDIVCSLIQSISRASHATETLATIQKELCSLGFQGADAGEKVQVLRDQFRTAHLELERAVPGETPDAGLDNGATTLSALVKRVQVLVNDLGEERMLHQGSADREKSLRGQYNTLLAQYEAVSKKVHDLEESIAASASDMLHTRMRMQELEREGQEHVISVDRLNTALSKYHDEVKNLEVLVTRLEDEKSQQKEKHTQQVSELERKIAYQEQASRAADLAIADRERQIRDMESVIEQNRIRVCDLTAKAESLERQLNEAAECLEHSTAEREQEIGRMNVRVAELNTALEAAKAEADKLRRTSTGLEEQLRLEVESRDNLLDQWVAEQTRAYTSMKATISAERRKAKARAANWELKSDELQSDSMGAGSEPITPVSMTRFVDVEVGRGKHRRRLDSGIGILTDELEDDMLPSDPADL